MLGYFSVHCYFHARDQCLAGESSR
jgi:hypothetical protein